MNLRVFSIALAGLLAGGASVYGDGEAAGAPAAGLRRFVGYRSGFNRDTLALQVLLDRQNLSCNCVDGMWGTRTEIALMAWQALNGLPATGVPDASVLEALGGDADVLTRYTVTAADVAALGGPVPQAWEVRAKLPALAYETLQEMLAEKGHASQRVIARLNPGVAWPDPPDGTEVVLPDCSPPGRLPRAGSIRISLARTEITVFDAEGRLAALFPCSIARDKAKRPGGEVAVRVVAPNPNYTYDPQLFEPGGEKKTKLVIPPGPNNPVGLAWIGLSLQGYGMHGTPVPEHIGRAESKGCFRLANWNAVKLLGMVEIGTPVVIEE
jgi:lipoprotein-anchoring transpeptidase ErfK/SrfK